MKLVHLAGASLIRICNPMLHVICGDAQLKQYAAKNKSFYTEANYRVGRYRRSNQWYLAGMMRNSRRQHNPYEHPMNHTVSRHTEHDYVSASAPRSMLQSKHQQHQCKYCLSATCRHL